MLKYVVFLSCSSLLCSSVSLAEAPPSPPLSVSIHFGTGMLSFNDLYLPLSNTDPYVPHLRADGNIREADSLNHYGIAVECGLTLSYQWEKYQLGYQLGYRRAGSLGVEGRYADSSYANTFTGVKLFYRTEAEVMPGVGLALQRVAFSNLATTHTVMSLIPTAELRLPLVAGISATGFIGYALWDRLGYASNVQLLGKEFRHAQVSTWQVGAAARKAINANASIVLAVQREHVDIHLDDINAYKQFGLHLYTAEPTPQDMPLRATAVSLSLQRDF